MSKELKFEFNDYIIAIDEPYEKDCGYVAIGKKDTKDNINIWFKSFNEQTVDFYIELQKHIADLEAKLAEKDEKWETLKRHLATASMLETQAFDDTKLDRYKYYAEADSDILKHMMELEKEGK